MTIKYLKEDNKGNLFTIDMLIAIVFLVLIVGITANIMDQTNEKINDHVARGSIEKIAIETVDNLIKTPGSPDKWEYESIHANTIPGLALKKDKVILNTISFRKLIALSRDYDNLVNKRIFNNDIKSTIAIYPLNSNIEPITIGNINENLNSVSEIASVNRTIQCDYLSENVLLSFNSYDNHKELCINSIENHTHENSYFCKAIAITHDNLTNMNYYLVSSPELINTNSYWSLNDPENRNLIEKSVYETIHLNNDLNYQLNGENEKKIWMHIKPSNQTNFESYLVAIPKGLDLKDIGVDDIKYEYFKLNNAYFVFKVWY
ncbi:hypothetical protein [Methanobrevibacter filiformis]|uniref:Uncharacterized protein n=1 Tax=Methanobrevibacter filiformis TaxID=55758 RepID=A0A166FF94_9EURY|nr:hypothetical protein [Methanobrevibacter filiformis]KZX17615.1 hypothetical protein MBFIL_00440 [Methanobrevibacter filiformis]